MTEFINQGYFDSEFAMLKAIGRQSRAPFTGVDPNAPDPGFSGGIASPERVELPVGRTLVRFARTRLPAAAIAGEWWLRWKDYEPIEKLADRFGLPVATAVRRKIIVPPEWGNMGFMVQVKVIAPLLAYGGIGRPVKSRDDGVMTGRELDGSPAFQLLIPGLSNPDMQREALFVQGCTFLDPETTTRGFINRNVLDPL